MASSTYGFGRVSLLMMYSLPGTVNLGPTFVDVVNMKRKLYSKRFHVLGFNQKI